MKKETRRELLIAVALLAVFALWTAAVCFVDVQAIGPRGSSVGLATLNRLVHRLTGVHMGLYVITDWLSLAPVGVGLVFALLGLCQWMKRKSLAKVDADILLLGGFYLAVLAVYLLFEMVVINRRPVLIDGVLEASYPSSTTMLVMCVMPTAALQAKARIRHAAVRRSVIGAIHAYTVLMVAGRLISGVHWVTDIIGGALLSGGLVLMYHALCGEWQNASPKRTGVLLINN